MKNPQRPTPDADLERKHRLCWWWRSFGTPDWEEIGNGLWSLAFKSWYERSAFLYELRARFNGSYEFKQPWTFLGIEKHNDLARRWPVDSSRRFASVNTVADSPPDGFTSFVGKNAYNLRLSNDTLARTFLSWIELERRRTGIRNPKPNEGLKRRSISWRPIELLDIQRLKLRVLTDAERSQISKVKKQFKRVFNSASS